MKIRNILAYCLVLYIYFYIIALLQRISTPNDTIHVTHTTMYIMIYLINLK